MNKATILIIENDSNSLLSLSYRFQNYHFIFKHNQEIIVEDLDTYKTTIDLIIIDDEIENPIALIRDIRKHNKSIPLYLIASTQASERNATHAGITGFIPAPFDYDDFECVFSQYKFQLRRKAVRA